MANSNRDYLADFCMASNPIEGLDYSRGYVTYPDGTTHQSEIEDWRFPTDEEVAQGKYAKDDRVYVNPMIRAFFFDGPDANDYLTRAKADIDPQAYLSLMPIYNTTADYVKYGKEGRAAYYLNLPGVSPTKPIPLNRLRYLASTGKDRNGTQKYDGKTYVIGFDGPGVFTLTVQPDNEDEDLLTFTPPKK